MIKDISSENIYYDVGSISISVDEIIQIIETKKITNVSAKNKNIQFENLDDIKSHKALFSGSPSLHLGNILISFRSYSTTLSYYGNNKLESSLATSIFEELCRHKTILDKMSEWKIFSFAFLMVFFLFNLLKGDLLKKIGLSDLQENIIDLTILAFLLIATLVSIRNGYSLFFRQAVHYTPTQNFFKRNFETICVSTITGVIGVIIGTIGQEIIKKLQSLF